MTLSDSCLRACHELALAVAPCDLSDRPLYLLRAADLDEQTWQSSFECLGCAVAGSRTLVFANALGDRWQGIGSAIILDAARIESAATPETFQAVARGVVVHEIAHLVPALPPLPVPADYEPPPAFKRMATEKWHATMTAPDAEPGDANDPHDSRFIRRCCHAAYRAMVRGADIGPLERLFGETCFPWVRRPEFYIASLLRELEKMANESFAEIEATSPPADFIELWRADVRDYHRIFTREI